MPAAPEWTASLAAVEQTTRRRQQASRECNVWTLEEEEKALKKLTVLCRDDSLHQDRQRGDALQPLDILHVHKRSTASRVVVAPCIGIISSYQSKIIIPSSSVCGQFARQRTTQAQNRWPANAKQAGFISHQYQWVRECEQKRSAGKNSEDVTNLVHLAEVQALKVLQRQVWRQNEPAVVQTFCCLAMSGVGVVKGLTIWSREFKSRALKEPGSNPI